MSTAPSNELIAEISVFPDHGYARTKIPGAPASDATDINILLDDVE